VLALEEIAAGDGATSTVVSVQNSLVCGITLAYGSLRQKQEWLPRLARGEALGCFCLTEPHVGSDASAIRTVAVREGDSWVIDGVKQFISTGKNADVALVLAVTDPAAGKKGISCFLVPTDTPGLSRHAHRGEDGAARERHGADHLRALPRAARCPGGCRG